MYRIPACSGARSCAGFRAVVFVAGLCAFVLSGCGGGGGGGGKGGGSGGGSTPPPAPVNQSGAVSISGTPTQGQTLTATVQDGNGVPGNVLYQWMADGSAISGVVGKSLTLAQAQVGKAISVRASYTDPNNFAENPTSAATAPVSDANVAPTLRLAPSNIVTTDFAHGHDAIYGLETLPDDKILAVGRADTSKGGTSDFALARYLPDGILDPTFGTGGKTTTDFSGHSDYIYSRPAITADGKIVVAGGAGAMLPIGNTVDTDIGVARYLANGNIDSSFGDSGRLRIDFAGFFDWGNAVAVDSQSRILAAGGTTDPITHNYQFAVVRLTPQGALDNTFGGDGKVTVDFAPLNGIDRDYANDMLLQPDGKILLSGYAAGNFGLVRLNADGSLDSTFGTGGKVTADFGNTSDEANRMALTADGKILVTGYSSTRIAVLRYNTNGTVDTNFGTNGSVLTEMLNPAGGSRPADSYDIKISNDNNFIVVGTHHDTFESGRQNLAIASYSGNGTLLGTKIIDASGNTDLGFSLAMTRNGGLLVGGRAMNHTDYRTDFVIARFDSAGNEASWATGLPRAVFVEHGNLVPLARIDAIGDDDISPGTGNYANYTLMIQRREGPNDSDIFTGIANTIGGTMTINSYGNGTGNVTVSNKVVGQYVQNNGKLTVTFNSQAAQDDVRTVAASIHYSNTNRYAFDAITLDWRFSDESGNSTTASSEMVIANDYLDIYDPRIDFSTAPDLENLWWANQAYFSFHYTTVAKISHDTLDAAFNADTDTTDVLRTAYLVAIGSTSHRVSLATLSELQALRTTASRPSSYASGEFWTATSAGPGQHYVIDMATGAVRSAADTEVLHSIMIVHNPTNAAF